MTLYEYLNSVPEGAEVTVWDTVYDIETYFYNEEPDDRWSTAVSDLSKLLTVKEIHETGVSVNLSELLEEHIDNLRDAELFIKCDIDAIMYNIDLILAGNVSEDWMEKFVAVLS